MANCDTVEQKNPLNNDNKGVDIKDLVLRHKWGNEGNIVKEVK